MSLRLEVDSQGADQKELNHCRKNIGPRPRCLRMAVLSQSFREGTEEKGPLVREQGRCGV